MAATTQRIYELQVKLAAQSLADLKKLQTTAQKTDKTMSSLTNSLKGLALGYGISKTITSVIDATIKQEEVMAALESVIESTGGAAGYTAQELQKMAAGFQQVTTYGDEVILDAQKLLLTFTNIGKDAFPRATKAVLDMATVMKTDLNSAAVQLGKALQDPVKGMTAMSKSGVSFTPVAQQLIKDLVAVGDIAGAQNIIFGEMDTQFKNAAEAARNTLGGAIKALHNTFGDLLEDTSGGPSALTEQINALNDTLSDPAVKAGFAALTQAIIALATAAAAALPAVVDFTRWAAEEVAATFNGVSLDDFDRMTDRLERLTKVANQRMDAGIEIDPQLANEISTLQFALADLEEERAKAAAAPPLVITSGTGAGAPAKLADDVKKATKAVKELKVELETPAQTQIEAMRTEAANIISANRTALEKFNDQIQRANELRERGLLIGEQYNREVWNAADAYQSATDKANDTNESLTIQSQILANLESQAPQFAANMAGSLVDIALEADSAADAFSNMAKSILSDIAKMIIQMQIMALLKATFPSLGAADGAVIDAGVQVQPFAKGGVVTKPTIFPMANGTGLMGEAGPEAIMPLTRLPSGKLGVESAGNSGGNVVVNVVNNTDGVATAKQETNADGETVITVMVERAVERGISTGRFDSTFSTVYGLNRKGR